MYSFVLNEKRALFGAAAGVGVGVAFDFGLAWSVVG